MTIPAFPSLIGISFPVGRKPTFATLKRAGASGRATALQLQTYPNYTWEVSFDYLQAGKSGANADWQVLAGFFNSVGGAALPFHWTDPYDGTVTAQSLGTGDGSTTAFNFVRTLGGFTEPMQDVSAGELVYVNDWRGNQLQYKTARTNNALRSNDLSNAAWTKTTATCVKDQTGPDGVVTGGSSMLATAGNATALQAITLVSAAYTYSVWLKRITGTGTIQLTMDNGSTWTTVVLTASWALFSITQTLANPTIGIRIVTNTDKIAVDFNQLEAGSVATSSISTGAAPITVTDYALAADPDWGATYGVTFQTAPLAAAAITATFSYRWLCWFDDDYADFSNIMYDFWQLGKISFTSVKTR